MSDDLAGYELKEIFDSVQKITPEKESDDRDKETPRAVGIKLPSLEQVRITKQLIWIKDLGL